MNLRKLDEISEKQGPEWSGSPTSMATWTAVLLEYL